MSLEEPQSYERKEILDFSTLFGDEREVQEEDLESSSREYEIADLWTSEAQDSEYAELDGERYLVTSEWEKQMRAAMHKEKIETLNEIFLSKMDSVEEVAQMLDEWGIDPEHYYVKEWKTTAGVKYQPMLRMLGGMQRRRKPDNGKGAKKRNQRRQRPAPQRQLYQAGRVLPNTPVLMPDEFPIRLKWRQDGVLSGSSVVATRVHTNALYDVDPAAGGWSVNGYTTYSRLYKFNRVVKCKVKVEISNQEASAVRLNFIHTNTDPGTSGSSYLNWSQSQYGFTRMLGPGVGSSNFTYIRVIDPRSLIGDRLTRTDSRYVGTDSANPADTTYFGFMAQDANGVTMSNGVAFTIELTFDVQFFDRKIVDEMYAPPPPPRLLLQENGKLVDKSARRRSC